MDNTIYRMIDGKLTAVKTPRNPESFNFLIVCGYGDWSGFRSLVNCIAQFPELEATEAKRPGRRFRVVER